MILISPIVLVFALIALVCFIIAIPSLIVFGIIYLVYKYYVKDKESKTPLVLFVIALALFTPFLLIFILLFLPFGIVILLTLYIIYGNGDIVGSQHKLRVFKSGYI